LPSITIETFSGPHKVIHLTPM